MFTGDFVEMAAVRAALGADVPDFIVLSEAVRRASTFSAGAAGAGGYVYFNPGRYAVSVRPAYAAATSARVRSLRLAADVIPPVRVLRVPENVTLWFAEGAVLSLAYLANIEIAGSIRAGRHQIFEPPSGTSGSRGRVIFIGSKVAEVYPEWWGARAEDRNGIAADSADAIQAAIDAAHTHRLVPRYVFDGGLGVELSVADQYTPIPVVLSGRYQVSRRIEVGGRGNFRTSPDGVALRGVAGVAPAFAGDTGLPTAGSRAAAPSLAPYTTFAGESLLRIVGSPGFVVEHVHFNAMNRADACVQVEPRAGVSSRGGLFDRCTFARSNVRLVSVGPELLGTVRRAQFDPSTQLGRPFNPDIAAAIPARATDVDATGLRFEGCAFNPSPAPGGSASDSYGLEVHASRSHPVLVSSCRFEGSAAAMILAWSGALALTACTFHNTLRPDAAVAPAGAAPNSVDVFLALPPPFVKADGAVQSVEPASFGASHCDSKSYQFLSTFGDEGFTRTPADVPDLRFMRRPTVLVNVRHGDFARNAMDLPLGVEQPSIAWGSAGKLVLVGCSLRSLSLLGATRVESVASDTGPITRSASSEFSEAVSKRVVAAISSSRGAEGFREEELDRTGF